MSMSKTKEAIFNSAVKIFAEKGFEKATMDEIAFSAGVAKGTLYYHFKSKDDIFKFIVTSGMEMIYGRMKENTSMEKNPINILKRMCKTQMILICENKDIFRTIISELWGKEGRQLEVRKVIKDYILNIQKYIDEAIKDGTIKNINSEFAAYTFFGTICSISVYELMNKDNEDIENLIDSLLGALFNVY